MFLASWILMVCRFASGFLNKAGCGLFKKYTPLYFFTEGVCAYRMNCSIGSLSNIQCPCRVLKMAAEHRWTSHSFSIDSLQQAQSIRKWKMRWIFVLCPVRQGLRLTNCCTMLMQPNTYMNNWYFVGMPMPYQYTTICVGMLSCSSVFLWWHICLQFFYLWKPLKLALMLGSGSRHRHATAPFVAKLFISS